MISIDEWTHSIGNLLLMTVSGYSNGDLERFNIQSGQHRTSYGDPAHTAPVRGVITDSLNQMVVSGCSVGYVKFWHFKNLGMAFLKYQSLKCY